MNPGLNQFGVAAIGGAEIILILFLLCVLAVLAAGAGVVIWAIIRAVQNRPPPVSLPLAPEVQIESQRRRDREHLKLLAIFHFIFAGLALLGTGFLCVHYAFMQAFFSNPEMWKSQKQAPPPKEFLDAFHLVLPLYGRHSFGSPGAECSVGDFPQPTTAPIVLDGHWWVGLRPNTVRDHLGCFHNHCVVARHGARAVYAWPKQLRRLRTTINPVPPSSFASIVRQMFSISFG